MKIAYVINVDFALLHFLLPLMRAARARGHEVIGLCAEGPLLDGVRAEGFRIIPVPLVRRVAPVAQWRAFRNLTAVFRAERPGLVHAHMPISGLVGRAAARWAGVPRIAYTCHGFLFNQPGSWPRRGASLVLEWAAGRITDDYLTVSAADALAARRLGIARGAVAVGNGRDPALFRPDAAARRRIRAELETPEERVVVIAVSRLVRHKGYPELLAAMRDLQADLWVVGERLASDHGDDMEAVFAQCGLGSRLRRLGYRDDVAATLAAADVFALPSHFEGLPMSIIEAMLVGLPVVASDISGPREQVVEDQTGLLVAAGAIEGLAAALRRLVGDAGLRRRMGEAGRRRAMVQFNEARVVGRTLDLLRL